MAKTAKKQRVVEGENPLQGASSDAVQAALDKALGKVMASDGSMVEPLTAQEVMESVPAQGVAEGRAHAKEAEVFGEALGYGAIPKKFVLRLGKTFEHELYPKPLALLAVATSEKGRDEMMRKAVNGLRVIEPKVDTGKDGKALYAVYVFEA
jgi:hypothetical protein